MATRKEFLSTGLIPCKAALQDEDCSICMTSYSEPVALPCTHVYCKECIRRWLESQNKNSCPLCKKRLFVLPDEEYEDVNRARRVLVVDAMRNSGLLTRAYESRVLDTYGSTLYDISDLDRAVAHASHFLTESFATPPFSGPSLIKISPRFSASFVAMGNLIQEFAKSSGREYTSQQGLDWKTLLTHLWSILRQKDGKRYDGLVLPAKLFRAVQVQLDSNYRDGSRMDFLRAAGTTAEANPHRADFDLLLNYLSVCCKVAQYDVELAIVQRREADMRRGIGAHPMPKCTIQ